MGTYRSRKRFATGNRGVASPSKRPWMRKCRTARCASRDDRAAAVWGSGRTIWSAGVRQARSSDAHLAVVGPGKSRENGVPGMCQSPAMMPSE